MNSRKFGEYCWLAEGVVLVQSEWKRAPGEQEPARPGLLAELAHDDDEEYHRHYIGEGVHVTPPFLSWARRGSTCLGRRNSRTGPVFSCKRTILEHPWFSSATALGAYEANSRTSGTTTAALRPPECLGHQDVAHIMQGVPGRGVAGLVGATLLT
jgi:hypothetical protein